MRRAYPERGAIIKLGGGWDRGRTVRGRTQSALWPTFLHDLKAVRNRPAKLAETRSLRNCGWELWTYGGEDDTSGTFSQPLRDTHCGEGANYDQMSINNFVKKDGGDRAASGKWFENSLLVTRLNALRGDRMHISSFQFCGCWTFYTYSHFLSLLNVLSEHQHAKKKPLNKE